LGSERVVILKLTGFYGLRLLFFEGLERGFLKILIIVIALVVFRSIIIVVAIGLCSGVEFGRIKVNGVFKNLICCLQLISVEIEKFSGVVSAFFLLFHRSNLIINLLI
jgi:hypothetical protein